MLLFNVLKNFDRIVVMVKLRDFSGIKKYLVKNLLTLLLSLSHGCGLDGKIQSYSGSKNQLGQSTVEYILLIAVITSIGYAFFITKDFKIFSLVEMAFLLAWEMAWATLIVMLGHLNQAWILIKKWILITTLAITIFIQLTLEKVISSAELRNIQSHDKKNNKGQSTIEFILTFTAAIGFVFLFLKMAINYTDGYMVHHATYMASRSYLVGDAERQSLEDGDDRAFELATKVFQKYLPQGLISNFESKLKVNNPGAVKFPAFVGVWVEYSQKFSAGFIGGKESMTMRSESFLGREPTRSEAIGQICNAIKTVTGGSCDIHATLDDNGG